MKTLTYAPEVQAYVLTWDGRAINLSKDILSGSVSRRVNSVSTASLVLNNRNNRYTGKLSRMDRIVIFLKRVKFVQVFSGYLTKVPAYALYPTTASISAECTLKRLLHTYWDPGLPDSAELLIQQELSEGDSGIANTLIRLLNKVGGWDTNTIHIQQIPPVFLEFAKQNMMEQDRDVAIQNLIRSLGLGGAVAGIPQNPVTGGVGPEGLEAFLYALRMTESSNNYTARSTISTASGAYQYIDSTWNNYRGYARAWQAPKNVQDARARADHSATWEKYKDWEKCAAHHLYPIWANDKSLWGRKPPYPGNPTIREYVNIVMRHMSQYTPTGDSANPTPDKKAGKGRSMGATEETGTRDETLQHPLKGNPPITSGFGPRVPPVKGAAAYHYGVDFGVPAGTQVYAPASGTVKYSGFDTGSGNIIEISHAHGVNTRVHHMNSRFVESGQKVSQGQNIGTTGNTGTLTTGAHAHFEVKKNGKNVNPMSMIGKRLSTNPGGGVTKSWDDSVGAKGADDTGGADLIPEGDEIGYRDELIEYVDTAIFKAMFTTPKSDQLSLTLMGEKSLVNDVPLIESISPLVSGAMRRFQSAPNGDFVAFFPDQFGLFGSKAKLTLEDVELVDLVIDALDGPITTHVFTLADTMEVGIDPIMWQTGGGIVSVTHPYVFDQVLNLQPSKNSFFEPKEFIQRFGVRPLVNQVPQVKNELFEYFLALQTFMQKWSEQYATSVRFTFMPEVYPGMRAILPRHNLSIYIESVTHDFSYESGFRTNVVISSPASIEGKGMEGLPVGRV